MCRTRLSMSLDKRPRKYNPKLEIYLEILFQILQLVTSHQFWKKFRDQQEKLRQMDDKNISRHIKIICIFDLYALRITQPYKTLRLRCVHEITARPQNWNMIMISNEIRAPTQRFKPVGVWRDPKKKEHLSTAKACLQYCYLNENMDGHIMVYFRAWGDNTNYWWTKVLVLLHLFYDFVKLFITILNQTVKTEAIYLAITICFW